ncbi:MAG: terminase family protein [Paludibacteraceae bacterium]|nr:terminase family protein [Paludibacteraceae bacterium]
MIDIAQISEEYIKCVSDKSRIYMIENFLKTFDMRKNREVPFKLFPRQKDLIQAFRDYTRNITLKPRQAGITTTAAAFIACEIALADKESPETVLIVGRDLKLSQNLLEKIEHFLLQLPRWFWGEEFFSIDPKSDKNKKDIFAIHNKQRLELKNGCKVYAVSSGPNAARGISSVSWLIFDEAAFIENGLDVYAQAVATTSTGGKTIMISTPCGKDQLYYGIYNKALNGQNDYHITELRWYQDPRYNCFLKWQKFDEDTKALLAEYEEPTLDKDGNIKYDPEHWAMMEREGYKPTSPWYVGMCNAFNNDPIKIAQELDVSFVGSSDNVVDPMYIEMQKTKNVREPDPELHDKDFEEVWIWKLPIEGHQYILSVDNSRGDSDDATALEIFDLDGIDDDGMPCIEQVLEYSGKLFGDVIGELANNYGRLYNNAFCVVESIGGYGDASLLKLMDLKYPNLYYDDDDLKTYMKQNRVPGNTKPEKMPGFHNGNNRFQMLSNFASMVRSDQFKIRSRRVIAELETWVWKNGKQDHMDGFHDDTITCLAMGLFVVQFSMKKEMRNKAMDASILRAMIQANSRIKFGAPEKQAEVEKKFTMPVYYSHEPLHQEKSAAYKAAMWLIG